MSSNSLSLPSSSTTEGPWLAQTYIIILLGDHWKRPWWPGSLKGLRWPGSMKGAPWLRSMNKAPVSGVNEKGPSDWGQWLEPQKETLAGGSMRKYPHLLLAQPLTLRIRVCSHTYVICSEITLDPNLHFGFFSSVPALPTYLHRHHHSDVVNESENCVCSFRIKIETLSNSP